MQLAFAGMGQLLVRLHHKRKMAAIRCARSWQSMAGAAPWSTAMTCSAAMSQVPCCCNSFLSVSVVVISL